jgi:hypothetical protein
MARTPLAQTGTRVSLEGLRTEATDEILGPDTERPSEADDVDERQVALAALDRTDVGLVHPGFLGELLKGPAQTVPEAPNTFAELRPWIPR